MGAKEILTSYHTVMSYELDAFGHVNNAIYLNYLEKARNDYMVLKGLQFIDFFKWQKFPVVRRAKLEFNFPAQAGDKLKIEGWVSHHTLASFTLEYNIKNSQNDVKILSGETFHIFVNNHNRPVRIPQEFMEKFIIPNIQKPKEDL
jgi:YbgC/YbaW family acyl-CoA thioester hydrolase